jgi:hypothetical protein
MSLTGPEKLAWQAAFVKAFTWSAFDGLLLGLDDRIDGYVGRDNSIDEIILRTVNQYEMRGEEDKLLDAARKARPHNPAISGLRQSRDGSSMPRPEALETIIRDSNSMLDFGLWLEKAVKIERAICRIEIPLSTGKTAFGTGFLVSPDLLVPNFHVVDPLLGIKDGAARGIPIAASGDVICRFDYRVMGDGTKSAGTTYSLAPEWKVFLSPNNKREDEPTIDTLDCAILRLARPAENLAAGTESDGPGAQRGWIDWPQAGQSALKPRDPMFIVQHPQAEPVKLALDTDAITSVNASQTRVRYKTNTEPGSSGSPCFDQNWKLVALHHSGDPNFALEANEGIPIDRIIGKLKEKGIIH